MNTKKLNFEKAVEKIQGLVSKAKKYGFNGFNFKNKDAIKEVFFNTLKTAKFYFEYDEKNHIFNIYPKTSTKTIKGILIRKNDSFKVFLNDKNTVLTISAKLEKNTFKSLEYGIESYNFGDWVGLTGKALA